MRILIATVTAGAGHLVAAAALDEAWRAFRPEDVVEKTDFVKFMSPLHRKIHADGYVKLVEHAPEVWGLMFGKTDNPEVAKKLTRWKRAFPGKSRGRMVDYFKRFEPDIVLCTHYVPLEALNSMRTEKRRGAAQTRHPFVVSIVTDFEAHALWMNPCVDLYCVAAEETKARLIARGATPSQVIATGIPIAAKFSSKPDPESIRHRMGLRDDQPVFLVLSGGFGMGPVAGILAELDKVAREFQTVVVTGRNEELRREIAAQDRKHPTHVLGFASNMHELVAISDLIISKPGGLTTSEVLAMGKPLFVINPIPGQEAANSDFLLERGAAAKVNRLEDLPFRIDQLLGSNKLREMARAAKALGRPDAARAVCEAALKGAEGRTSGAVVASGL